MSTEAVCRSILTRMSLVKLIAVKRAIVYKTIKKAHIRHEEKRIIQEIRCPVLQKWKNRLTVAVKGDTHLNE